MKFLVLLERGYSTIAERINRIFKTHTKDATARLSASIFPISAHALFHLRLIHALSKVNNTHEGLVLSGPSINFNFNSAIRWSTFLREPGIAVIRVGHELNEPLQQIIPDSLICQYFESSFTSLQLEFLCCHYSCSFFWGIKPPRTLFPRKREANFPLKCSRNSTKSV